MKSLSLIAAVSKHDWAIGSQGSLPWSLPTDLAFFRQYTMGKTIIMGRKTAASLPKALPGRTNIVVSSNYYRDGFRTVPTLMDALDLVEDDQHAVVIGGERMYDAALPLVDEVVLSWVHGVQVKNPDAFFPSSFKDQLWKITSSDLIRSVDDEYPYTRTTYHRRTK